MTTHTRQSRSRLLDLTLALIGATLVTASVAQTVPPTSATVVTSTSTSCPYRDPLVVSVMVADQVTRDPGAVSPSPSRAQIRSELMRQIDVTWSVWDNGGRKGAFLDALAIAHLPDTDAASRAAWVATIREMLKRRGVTA